MTENITLDSIKEKMHNREIIGIETSTNKLRLFVSTFGTLCYFKGKSRNRGCPLEDSQLIGFKKFIYNKEDNTVDTFKIISKFRKYAMKASFTNKFIEDCKKLPATLEQWQSEGSKGCYEYGITTGVTKEGEVITVDALGSICDVNYLRECIKNKKEFSAYRQGFRGYDATITIDVKDGVLCGFLAMEYKNCGNGHYYLLINDENFIYYDKD